MTLSIYSKRYRNTQICWRYWPLIEWQFRRCRWLYKRSYLNVSKITEQFIFVEVTYGYLLPPFILSIVQRHKFNALDNNGVSYIWGIQAVNSTRHITVHKSIRCRSINTHTYTYILILADNTNTYLYIHMYAMHSHFKTISSYPKASQQTQT